VLPLLGQTGGRYDHAGYRQDSRPDSQLVDPRSINTVAGRGVVYRRESFDDYEQPSTPRHSPSQSQHHNPSPSVVPTISSADYARRVRSLSVDSLQVMSPLQVGSPSVRSVAPSVSSLGRVSSNWDRDDAARRVSTDSVRVYKDKQLKKSSKGNVPPLTSETRGRKGKERAAEYMPATPLPLPGAIQTPYTLSRPGSPLGQSVMTYDPSTSAAPVFRTPDYVSAQWQ